MGVVGNESDTNRRGDTMNLYEIPEIARLMKIERESKDPEVKRLAHNQWVRLMKAEQVKRGQRSR